MPEVDLQDVHAAAKRIKPWVHQTPVLTSSSIDQLVGAPVYFKCENLQKVGAFKARGACNAVALTDAPVVATHSSGNHGAALAYAASVQGRSAIVVVPHDASPVKVANIERYGAQVVRCGATLKEREAALAAVIEKTGAHEVPPYDDPRVIAGQGTAALEFMSTVPELTSIWVPVGGGGLAAGAIVALDGQGCRVIGAEPSLADDAAVGLALGVRQPQKPPVTCADGLRTSLGELNFKVLLDYGLQVVVVSEDEIVAAQSLLMSCLKVLVEPSSAVPFAAMLKAPPQTPAGVIITGGNLSL